MSKKWISCPDREKNHGTRKDPGVKKNQGKWGGKTEIKQRADKDHHQLWGRAHRIQKTLGLIMKKSGRGKDSTSHQDNTKGNTKK